MGIYLNFSRKHAIVCYHIKDKSWSMTALRDCYYSKSESKSLSNVDLDSVEWECLQKHCKLDLKSGYIISLLQNCEHTYQIFINETTTKDENTQNNSQTEQPSIEKSLFNNDTHGATLKDDEEHFAGKKNGEIRI